MTDLILSLQITALGMGLVFGAILLLWLMMVILTALTAEKDASTTLSVDSASDSAATAPVSETDYKLQAAAIAVAVALAEQELSSAHPLPDPPTAIVSAWQLGMRTSQRSQKGNFRRH
ncbi:MAG: OadG family protein [Anaerolineales bacterium]|nr:OadG family protein [Anaerolineales bacterium]